MLYNAKFYKNNTNRSFHSAGIILSLLFKIYQPKSVIDFGCGHGGWLKAAELLGAKTLMGLDGAWVNPAKLMSKNIQFEPVNFENDIHIENKFDLCISVEVAEHLAEKSASLFVETLCNSSDVVLFSAAVEYQGGVNHINEQWQSYWIELFHKNGYLCLDFLRKIIWDNPRVRWWYKQNIFLFVKKSNSIIDWNFYRDSEKAIYDIVHPDNYKIKVNKYQYPTLKFCISCLKDYVLINLKKMINNI